MPQIKSILSIIFHEIYGAVCIQLTHFSYDDCEYTCSLSYHHHQIGNGRRAGNSDHLRAKGCRPKTISLMETKGITINIYFNNHQDAFMIQTVV